MNTRQIVLMFVALLLALGVVAAVLFAVYAISPQEVTNDKEPPFVPSVAADRNG